MESQSDAGVSIVVQEIIKKIRLSLERLQKSSFYRKFVRQIQKPEMMTRIERVRSTDPHHSQLQVVLYGVGVIDPNKDTDVEPQHMQLCLAILLRENFEWVNDIVVYDPVLSTIEQEAINSFDCNCLSVNENGRRTVNRPTLFFMPHCDIRLTDRVLEANWTPENLNKIIILGNSLKGYDLGKKRFAYHRLTNKIQVILDSDHMLHEIPLPHTTISLSGARHCSIGRLYERSFSDFSWHFFDWDGLLHGFQRQDSKMFAFRNVKCNRLWEEIILKTQLGVGVLRNSPFYVNIMAQMNDPEMVRRIENLRRTDPYHSELQVVVHGIGMGKTSNCMQIAFAILLRQTFHWVDNIVLYDTSLSAVERAAMKALNYSFLSLSKHGRWSANRPTLFFMPGSQVLKYINLLRANWTPSKLNKFIVLGQSLKHFTQRFGTRESKDIMNNERILHEISLPETTINIPWGTIQQNGSNSSNEDPVYREAFDGLTWHFFGWDPLLDGVDRGDVRSFFGWDRLCNVSQAHSKFSPLFFP